MIYSVAHPLGGGECCRYYKCCLEWRLLLTLNLSIPASSSIFILQKSNKSAPWSEPARPDLLPPQHVSQSLGSLSQLVSDYGMGCSPRAPTLQGAPSRNLSTWLFSFWYSRGHSTLVIIRKVTQPWLFDTTWVQLIYLPTLTIREEITTGFDVFSLLCLSLPIAVKAHGYLFKCSSLLP